MRRSLLAAIFASSLLASACGGSVAPVEDGGALDANGDGASDARPDDGAPGDGALETCAALEARLETLRTAARECCPVCRALQCTIMVEDLCCPLSATSPQPEMVAAVAEYKSRCGPVACPAMPCSVAPSGTCDPSASDPSVGTCR